MASRRMPRSAMSLPSCSSRPCNRSREDDAGVGHHSPPDTWSTAPVCRRRRATGAGEIAARSGGRPTRPRRFGGAPRRAIRVAGRGVDPGPDRTGRWHWRGCLSLRACGASPTLTVSTAAIIARERIFVRRRLPRAMLRAPQRRSGASSRRTRRRSRSGRCSGTSPGPRGADRGGSAGDSKIASAEPKPTRCTGRGAASSALRQMLLDGGSGIVPARPVARHRMAQQRGARRRDQSRQVGFRIGGAVPPQPDQGQLGDFGQHARHRLPNGRPRGCRETTARKKSLSQLRPVRARQYSITVRWAT